MGPTWAYMSELALHGVLLGMQHIALPGHSSSACLHLKAARMLLVDSIACLDHAQRLIHLQGWFANFPALFHLHAKNLCNTVPPSIAYRRC